MNLCIVYNKVSKLPSCPRAPNIYGPALQAMKLTFTGDMSKTSMEHLHAIEDLFSLFKLADVPHDHVKMKLLYLFLSCNGHMTGNY